MRQCDTSPERSYLRDDAEGREQARVELTTPKAPKTGLNRRRASGSVETPILTDHKSATPRARPSCVISRIFCFLEDEEGSPLPFFTGQSCAHAFLGFLKKNFEFKRDIAAGEGLHSPFIQQ